MPVEQLEPQRMYFTVEISKSHFKWVMENISDPKQRVTHYQRLRQQLRDNKLNTQQQYPNLMKAERMWDKVDAVFPSTFVVKEGYGTGF